jgi:mRNA-degrading endonuclease YafQ of YafQ-DinJ toxin-antitoxin module
MKNDPQIEYTPFFNKQRKAAPFEIKQAFLEALALFLESPKNPYLRNHILTKKLAGYRSINVTGDWRAVFKEKREGERSMVIFHMLGTHSALYG